MTIDNATKELVRKRANYLCEYCHSWERISATRFTVDHVRPKSLTGSDDAANLALAKLAKEELRRENTAKLLTRAMMKVQSSAQEQ